MTTAFSGAKKRCTQTWKQTLYCYTSCRKRPAAKHRINKEIKNWKRVSHREHVSAKTIDYCLPRRFITSPYNNCIIYNSLRLWWHASLSLIIPSTLNKREKYSIGDGPINITFSLCVCVHTNSARFIRVSERGGGNRSPDVFSFFNLATRQVHRPLTVAR